MRTKIVVLNWLTYMVEADADTDLENIVKVLYAVS